MFLEFLEKAGPKHSTSVLSSAEVAVPFSVDEKEVALVPNSGPAVAVKGLLVPQVWESCVLCNKVHSLPPPTLQMVTPFLSPAIVHLKVKESPGQVGGAAVNCPVTSPA